MIKRKNIDYKISYKPYKKGFFIKSKMMFVIEEYSWDYEIKQYDFDLNPYYRNHITKLNNDYYLNLKIKVVANFLTKELAEKELKNFKLNSYVEDTLFKM